MIQLPAHIIPPDGVLAQLRVYQAQIAGTFAEKQALVKRDTIPGFSSRNKISNPTFRSIREHLTKMCSGVKRCAYCEDAPADEVEHIYPKDLFPDRCFEWENYLYACGPCNGPKSNQFALFLSDGTLQILSADAEPPVGDSVLINPRLENGMDFCRLNLITFHFEIIAPPHSQAYLRADYTFNTVLRLNTQREYLREAREVAYGNYKSRLGYFISKKNEQVPLAQLEAMITQLKKEAHPTVWKEMQRSFLEGRLVHLDAELNSLFTTCPEALGW